MLLLLGLPVVIGGQALQPPQRVRGNVNDSETFVLAGNIRPLVEQHVARQDGKLPGGYLMPRMALHFKMTAAQNAGLEQLLRAQQDRHSSQYHKFLTPEDYAARFGVDHADTAKVVRWLEDSGFSDVQVARSRSWVSFAGTAAQTERTFHLSLHQYSLKGQVYFASTGEPHLPKALEGLVASVTGLHNFTLKPHLLRRHPHYVDSNYVNYLAPDDWETIYDVKPLYGMGIDGTGLTIAVVGQSDVSLTDLRAFRSAAGLPVKDPTVVIPPGDADPGIQSATGDESESDLDLEWAGAIARNANILFVTASATSDNGVQDAITYAIDNNVAAVLSTSYGACETDFTTAEFQAFNTVLQQASPQGMTVVAASGDAGATACDTSPTQTSASQGLAVDFPASSQYVTAVGGTRFTDDSPSGVSNNSYNGTALGYFPEMAWNDGFQASSGGWRQCPGSQAHLADRHRCTGRPCT